jgi:hypothetical protein
MVTVRTIEMKTFTNITSFSGMTTAVPQHAVNAGVVFQGAMFCSRLLPSYSVAIKAWKKLEVSR